MLIYFHVFCWYHLLSRADIKQYIGLPSATAVFKIYHSCIQELMRVRKYHLLAVITDLLFVNYGVFKEMNLITLPYISA